MGVSFDVSREEGMVIDAIAKRAVSEMPGTCSLLEISMDITVCHANGCPLYLSDLLAADRFDFAHDVLGISRHVDRKTGKMGRKFLPRYAKQSS